MNVKPKFFIDGSPIVRNSGQPRLFRVVSLCVYLAENGYEFSCIFDASLLGMGTRGSYKGSYLLKDEIPIAETLLNKYSQHFEMCRGGTQADRPLVENTHKERNSILISSDKFDKPDDDFAIDKDWLKKDYTGTAKLVQFYINSDSTIILFSDKRQAFSKLEVIPLDKDLTKLISRLDTALNAKKYVKEDFKRIEVTGIPGGITNQHTIKPKANIAKCEIISQPITNVKPKPDPYLDTKKYALLFLLLVSTFIVKYFFVKPKEIKSLPPVVILDTSSLLPSKGTINIQEPDITQIRKDLKERATETIDSFKLNYIFISDSIHDNALIHFEITQRTNEDKLFVVDYVKSSDNQWFYNSISEILQPIRVGKDTSNSVKEDTSFTVAIDSPVITTSINSDNATSSQNFLIPNIPVYEHPFADPHFVALTDIIIEDNGWKPDQMKEIQFYLSQDLILTREVSQENSEIVHGKIKTITGSKKNKVIIKAGTKGVLIDMPNPTKILVSFDGGNENYLSFGVNPNLKNKYMLLASDWSSGIGKVHYAGKEYYTNENAGKVYLVIDLEKTSETNIKSHKMVGRKLK